MEGELMEVVQGKKRGVHYFSVIGKRGKLLSTSWIVNADEDIVGTEQSLVHNCFAPNNSLCLVYLQQMTTFNYL